MTTNTIDLNLAEELAKIIPMDKWVLSPCSEKSITNLAGGAFQRYKDAHPEMEDVLPNGVIGALKKEMLRYHKVFELTGIGDDLLVVNKQTRQITAIVSYDDIWNPFHHSSNIAFVLVRRNKETHHIEPITINKYGISDSKYNLVASDLDGNMDEYSELNFALAFLSHSEIIHYIREIHADEENVFPLAINLISCLNRLSDKVGDEAIIQFTHRTLLVDTRIVQRAVNGEIPCGLVNRSNDDFEDMERDKMIDITVDKNNKLFTEYLIKITHSDQDFPKASRRIDDLVNEKSTKDLFQVSPFITEHEDYTDISVLRLAKLSYDKEPKIISNLIHQASCRILMQGKFNLSADDMVSFCRENFNVVKEYGNRILSIWPKDPDLVFYSEYTNEVVDAKALWDNLTVEDYILYFSDNQDRYFDYLDRLKMKIN